jgi:hypothetical protein
MLCFAAVLLFGYLRFGRFARLHARRAPEAVQTIGQDCAQTTAQGYTQTTAQGLWAVLTIIAVYSLVDGLWVMPYSQMLIVLFAAWSMATLRAAAPPPAVGNADPPWTNTATAAILLSALAISLTGIVLYGFPGIGKSQLREDAYQRATGVDFLFPRFWAQGWIGPLHPPRK